MQASTTSVKYVGKMWGAGAEGGDDDYEKGSGFKQGGVVMSHTASGIPLGKATLVYVKRHPLHPTTAAFFSACDSLLSDLQATGCMLFNANGSPRHARVKALLPPPSQDTGDDFLYLSDLDFEGVSEEDAPSALKDMLRSTLLRKKFALAAFYLSPPSSALSKRHNFMPAFGGKEPSAAEEDFQKWRREACALYHLHVVRAGFEQVGDTSVYIATPGSVKAPVLTRAQALPMREAPKEKELSPIDKELLDVYLEATSMHFGPEPLPAASLAKVKGMVEKGGSLVSSTVLHFVANSGNMAIFKQLVGVMPPGGACAAVNAQDFLGSTPLHLAACHAIGNVSRINPEAKTEFCAYLLSLGANKSTLTALGLSAFGTMLGSKSNYADFARTMGSQPHSKSLALERMLVPEEGPSAADKEHADVSELIQSGEAAGGAGGGGGSKRVRR